MADPNVLWQPTSNTPWVNVYPPVGAGSGQAYVYVDGNAIPLPGVYTITIAWTDQVGGGASGSGGTTTVTIVIGPY